MQAILRTQAALSEGVSSEGDSSRRHATAIDMTSSRNEVTLSDGAVSERSAEPAPEEEEEENIRGLDVRNLRN